MNCAGGELLVFSLLVNTVVCAVWCLTKKHLVLSNERLRWSLAERTSRQLTLYVLRTGSSVAALMLSWGYNEQLCTRLCASLAHLQ